MEHFKWGLCQVVRSYAVRSALTWCMHVLRMCWLSLRTGDDVPTGSYDVVISGAANQVEDG